MNTRLKNTLVNSMLSLIAVVFALLLAEFISRFFFAPGDYLKPEVLTDRWGMRIKPGSIGHDAWGFRNPEVPDRTEIVAIGDSNTYGVAARRGGTWPDLLEEFTGRSVYNMGMPGYGPVTYRHLLRSRALKLSPSLVLVGFYLGNDPWGAYKSVYRDGLAPDQANPNFPSDSLESGSAVLEQPDEKPQSSLKGLKRWLARKSVLYNLARYSEAVRFVQNQLQSKSENIYFFLNDDEDRIHTILQPQGLRAIDLANPAVREGLRLSLALISDMKSICERKGIKMIVILIPSKVAVYSSFLDRKKDTGNDLQLRKWAEYEFRINRIAKEYFKSNRIEFVDTLKPLEKEALREQVYPATADTHPNQHGYRIIARTIADYLLKTGLGQREKIID